MFSIGMHSVHVFAIGSFFQKTVQYDALYANLDFRHKYCENYVYRRISVVPVLALKAIQYSVVPVLEL